MSMTISVGDDRDDDQVDDLQPGERDDDDLEDDSRERRAQRRSDERDAAGDETDAADDEDKSPEELKAEIKRLRASLAKSNSTGLRRRNQLKELRQAQATMSGDDDTDDDEDEDGEKPAQKQRDGLDARAAQKLVSRAVKKREAELQEVYRRDLIDTRAESALKGAGVSEKNLRLLKRELDYDELELLKDRSVDGLDEEVDRLRGEFPDLFKSGKSTRRRINGGDDRAVERKKGPTTASQRQAAQLQGRG